MIPDSNPWLILAIVSTGLFLIGVDMTVLNVALPILAHDLGATTAEKLWMVNAYSLVLAGLLPGFGTLSDRIGHRSMFVAGLIGFGAASALAAFAPNASMLIAARAVLAIGAAMMLPATISIIRIVFTEDGQRAVAIGIWGSVSAGAAALGPILGGFLLEHFWWGSVFLINVPVVLVTLVLTYAKIPSLPGNPARYWDALTSTILTLALIALLYALKGVLKADIHWDEVIAAVIFGSAFFWWFVRRQQTLPSPLIDFALFRNSGFSIGAAGALFASFAMIGLQYVLVQKAQLVDGFTPLHAGLFVLPIAAGAFIAGPALGAYLFRVGVERMLAFAFGLAALGLTLFTLLSTETHMLWQIATLSITGFGLGGIMSVGSTSIMINAPEDKAGMAGSLEGIAYELGGTLGVAVLGSVISTMYTRSFAPPNAQDLDPSAWDSLDQTLIAADDLGTNVGGPIIEAARLAFVDGVGFTLAGCSALIIILFALTALHARKKRPC